MPPKKAKKPLKEHVANALSQQIDDMSLDEQYALLDLCHDFLHPQGGNRAKYCKPIVDNLKQLLQNQYPVFKDHDPFSQLSYMLLPNRPCITLTQADTDTLTKINRLLEQQEAYIILDTHQWSHRMHKDVAQIVDKLKQKHAFTIASLWDEAPHNMSREQYFIVAPQNEDFEKHITQFPIVLEMKKVPKLQRSRQICLTYFPSSGSIPCCNGITIGKHLFPEQFVRAKALSFSVPDICKAVSKISNNKSKTVVDWSSQLNDKTLFQVFEILIKSAASQSKAGIMSIEQNEVLEVDPYQNNDQIIYLRRTFSVAQININERLEQIQSGLNHLEITPDIQKFLKDNVEKKYHVEDMNFEQFQPTLEGIQNKKHYTKLLDHVHTVLEYNKKHPGLSFEIFTTVSILEGKLTDIEKSLIQKQNEFDTISTEQIKLEQQFQRLTISIEALKNGSEQEILNREIAESQRVKTLLKDINTKYTIFNNEVTVLQVKYNKQKLEFINTCNFQTEINDEHFKALIKACKSFAGILKATELTTLKSFELFQSFYDKNKYLISLSNKWHGKFDFYEHIYNLASNAFKFVNDFFEKQTFTENDIITKIRQFGQHLTTILSSPDESCNVYGYLDKHIYKSHIHKYNSELSKVILTCVSKIRDILGNTTFNMKEKLEKIKLLLQAYLDIIPHCIKIVVPKTKGSFNFSDTTIELNNLQLKVNLLPDSEAFTSDLQGKTMLKELHNTKNLQLIYSVQDVYNAIADHCYQFHFKDVFTVHNWLQHYIGYYYVEIASKLVTMIDIITEAPAIISSPSSSEVLSDQVDDDSMDINEQPSTQPDYIAFEPGTTSHETCLKLVKVFKDYCHLGLQEKPNAEDLAMFLCDMKRFGDYSSIYLTRDIRNGTAKLLKSTDRSEIQSKNVYFESYDKFAVRRAVTLGTPSFQHVTKEIKVHANDSSFINAILNTPSPRSQTHPPLPSQSPSPSPTHTPSPTPTPRVHVLPNEDDEDDDEDFLSADSDNESEDYQGAEPPAESAERGAKRKISSEEFESRKRAREELNTAHLAANPTYAFLKEKYDQEKAGSDRLNASMLYASHVLSTYSRFSDVSIDAYVDMMNATFQDMLDIASYMEKVCSIHATCMYRIIKLCLAKCSKQMNAASPLSQLRLDNLKIKIDSPGVFVTRVEYNALQSAESLSTIEEYKNVLEALIKVLMADPLSGNVSTEHLPSRGRRGGGPDEDSDERTIYLSGGWHAPFQELYRDIASSEERQIISELRKKHGLPKLTVFVYLLYKNVVLKEDHNTVNEDIGELKAVYMKALETEKGEIGKILKEQKQVWPSVQDLSLSRTSNPIFQQRIPVPRPGPSPAPRLRRQGAVATAVGGNPNNSFLDEFSLRAILFKRMLRRKMLKKQQATKLSYTFF